MGIKPRELLRTSEAIYRELGLGKKELSDDELISVMVKHPDLIQRPIAERGDRAVLGRPPENIVGTVDPFFPLAEVRATRDALNKQRFDVQLTEIKGHNHWYYDLAPKINADAWNFLKQQKLSEDPRYTQYAFK